MPGASFPQSFHQLRAVAFVLSHIHQSPCGDRRYESKDGQERCHDSHEFRRHLARNFEAIAEPEPEQLIPAAAAD
jgi:hypothetical protein